MTEKIMKRYLYDLYQLDWMITHGYSLTDLMRGMNSEAVCHDEHIFDTEQDGMHADIEGIFAEWEGDVGFPGGCIYVCFDEFCGAELLDKEYILWLLDEVAKDDDDLRDTYLEWLKNNEEE